MAGNTNNRWGTRSAATRPEPVIGATTPPPPRFSVPMPPPPPTPDPAPVYAAPARQLGPAREQRVNAREQRASNAPANPLLKPKVLIPALLVILVLGVAMGFTPGSGKPNADGALAQNLATTASATTPTTAPSSTASPSQTARSNITPVPANLTVNAVSTQNAKTPQDASIAPGHEDQVAGVQSTPTQAIAYAPTSCGELKETATSISVEQAVNGVSVRATQAAVYPIDYLSCILVATGSKDSLAIAQSLDKASREGATHGVVIDLWVANSNKDFGQVNLKTAMVAAAGQVFSPLATLNGRAEVVVTGGQGRSVSIVVAMTNTITDTTGPMTLQVDAPLIGGKPMPGKYTLFLPTP